MSPCDQLIELHRCSEELTDSLRRRFPEHTKRELAAIEDGYLQIEDDDEGLVLFRKICLNRWNSILGRIGIVSRLAQEYEWRLQSELRQELRCHVFDSRIVFLGYLSPVGVDDVPVKIPDRHMEDGEIDWERNELRWHDVRYVDVRMATASEFNTIHMAPVEIETHDLEESDAPPSREKKFIDVAIELRRVREISLDSTSTVNINHILKHIQKTDKALHKALSEVGQRTHYRYYDRFLMTVRALESHEQI